MNSNIAIVFVVCLAQIVTPMPGMMGGPGGFGGMGGFGAFGAINKQMGMSQAILKMGQTVAKNEVNAQLDAVKLNADAVGGVCGDEANAALTLIDTELLTAFDKCSMKAEMQVLRFQSLQNQMALKQQMASYKMSKKACKLDLDPVTCLADAAAANEAAMEAANPATAVGDLVTKGNDCTDEVKTDLLERINDVAENLLTCEN